MKVKRIPRKIGACGKETLIGAIGRALAAVSTVGASGFFAHRGYHAPVAATMKDAVRRYLTMDAF